MTMENKPLLQVKDLTVTFGERHNKFTAVKNVSFDIFQGETFGLVGESGSGKTTIGRTVIRINPAASGEILYDGERISGRISREKDREVTRKIQMIFQDPMASLNERAKVDYIVSEGLYNLGGRVSEEERRKRVAQALSDVGLLPEFASRFPHEFSGGQRQRVAIARSIAVAPELIVADEPVASLDVSIQAQIVTLFQHLQRQHNFTFLFIAHDLSMVRYLCDRVGVMYEGKLVEYNAAGEQVRPWDISITKVTFALLFNSVLLLVIVLSVAQWYRKRPQGALAPGGFIGFMEMFIMMVNDDIIKSCVGPNYRKFAPYLLTAFFFIFINNVMGLIPFFPGGANVTGNIAITMVLAICTFLAVNIFGTKHYWKDIFWPDVPWWLKVPVPMMPFIEFFGIFTKPFALMIRLFANMLAGHMAMLVLTCLIFISASMGPALNGTLTVASVLFNIFMNALELLVAFIQAYVFTMLSAVFIGLAQEGAKVKDIESK